jgi:hypothetical protein
MGGHWAAAAACSVAMSNFAACIMAPITRLAFARSFLHVHLVVERVSRDSTIDRSFLPARQKSDNWENCQLGANAENLMF